MYIISFKIVYTETSGKVFLEGCKLEVKFWELQKDLVVVHDLIER